MSESQIILLSLPCLPACQPAARVRPCSANTSSRIVCEYPIPGVEIWALSPSIYPALLLLPHLLADCILGLICMQCSSMRCTNYSTTGLVPRQTVHSLTQKISYFYGHCNAIKRSCSARSPRCLFLPMPYHTNFLSAPFSTVEDDWVSCWGKYGCSLLSKLFEILHFPWSVCIWMHTTVIWPVGIIHSDHRCHFVIQRLVFKGSYQACLVFALTNHALVAAPAIR